MVVLYSIEPMRESDWPQVRAIYQEGIVAGQLHGVWRDVLLWERRSRVVGIE